MSKFIDMTGWIMNEHGVPNSRLTVIERATDSKYGATRWLCRCSCSKNKTTIVSGTDLRSGRIKSCGCLLEEIRKSIVDDFTNMDFGYLHVNKRAPNHITPSGASKIMWGCTCTACNTTNVIVSSQHLKQGQISCGCMISVRSKEKATTHNGSNTRLYHIWSSMKRRCYSPTDTRYDIYGGRGIIVCDEWKNSFENFRDWALTTGYDENAPRGECTIERIDVNGNYCPENCTWATNKEQANNTRSNRIITINGVSKTVAQWAEYQGLPRHCISARLNKLGWSEYDAVMTPKGGKRNAC